MEMPLFVVSLKCYFGGHLSMGDTRVMTVGSGFAVPKAGWKDFDPIHNHW